MSDMHKLPTAQQAELQEIFGKWISFDREERRIYSHDVAAIPKLIRPIIGDTTAAAVVQPESEDQLILLVKWAKKRKVHLVPRAKATSGYGGVLPVKGGISVSMNRMHKIIQIDEEAMTARVESGVVWVNLERKLEKEGLALRTYPSSAPSSTVGGWLAQGGVGYGGLEYGCFISNVVSARVVLPTGEIRVFEGDDLDLVSEAEGITGFITEITVKIREKQPERIEAFKFPSSSELSAGLNEIFDKKLPLWSISFINPTMARLRNQLPPRLEHGSPVDNHWPRLPEDGYIAVLVAPEHRWIAMQGELIKILEAHRAEILDQVIADHEWEGRFNLMHVKRLGPSLLPAEVVVPLKRLTAVLDEAEAAIKQPLTLEGMVQVDLRGGGNRGLVTLLGFIPHDERTLSFGIAYSLSLTLVAIAKRHGGRVYSTGFYFPKQADTVLGLDRVKRLRAFKHRIDTQGIMNPCKVIDACLMADLLRLIIPFERFARVPANLLKSPVGERITGPGRKGIPDDIAWYAYACAQCGYCVDECDQYYGRGWESESPRGRWFFLRDYMEGRAEMTQEWVENFLACTTCEMCNVKCPLGLPNESSWMKMRGELVTEQDRLPIAPLEVMRASVEKEMNVWGARRKQRPGWITQVAQEKAIPETKNRYLSAISEHPWKRMGWVAEGLKDRIQPRAKIAYFAGCTASLVETDIAQGTARLLWDTGVEFTYLGEEENCCGLPILCSGAWDTFERVLKYNVKAMQKRGVKTVVTSCAACWLAWHTYYPQWAKKFGIPFDIKTRHYSEVLADKLKSGDLRLSHEVPLKVTWHDPCHIGRAGGIYEPPRELLKCIARLDFREMEHNREEARCCGSVLSLMEDPDGAALRIGEIRLKEAESTGAEALVTACPCCEVQFRVTAKKTSSPLRIIDLAHIVAEGVGIKLADPTDYALEQWETFEAMIKLLKPEAMAAFMASMLPEMVEAMPQPFRGVMKWIEHTSPHMRDSMIVMMRPTLPFLFPRLLPGMMPKLMPDMLTAMEKVVPMPDYMKEQMPELMPGVMGNLLPKMLTQVMPHFVPRMEAYLKHEAHSRRHRHVDRFG
jgi:Fe-S oxidoreductase/FAD/FMN-containing dehydrogenase